MDCKDPNWYPFFILIVKNLFIAVETASTATCPGQERRTWGGQTVGVVEEGKRVRSHRVQQVSAQGGCCK